ncbi:putative type IV pilus biogenesis protein PilE [Pseudogulbenkiania sp. NH8B]|uniref:type IV pilin protein n=1 Tax=Pseudogulbenkiania sp. (strain NH8B) TaxID=748280 RepID=UPI0002279EBE|nr:type IV pilin protein [Pseudogulbenkiania sp. NH8B]BAK76115.1 putative type IV pilus biogenesis protein PilE [Pseudogulbenkiania sp. NH8B]
MRKAWAGFTLIELLIAIVVVAILMSLAVPAYQDYVRRGRINAALAQLSQTRVSLEQYYADNRSYAASGTTCGATPSTVDYFTLACTASGSTGYTLGATGTTAMAGYTYSLNQSNSKSTTQYKGSTVSKSCWLIKGDEC